MTIQQLLLSFLQKLTAGIPPDEGCRHALMTTQYGSDSSGFEDKLTLQVAHGGLFYPFFLDADDFEKPVDGLVEEIAALLKSQVTQEDCPCQMCAVNETSA